MKLKCKCGRTLVLDPEKHAGKKVACKACGQRYRLPPRKAKDPTTQMHAWKEEELGGDETPRSANEVGAVPLGEGVAFTWILVSVLVTLVVTLGGAYGIKVGIQKAFANEGLDKYRGYILLATQWAPMLAFVISGWLTARMSPGRTITEPALGAAISVAVLAALVVFRPGPIETQFGAVLPNVSGLNAALKLNLFAQAMFAAACLSCAGAYFGEVAQERSSV